MLPCYRADENANLLGMSKGSDTNNQGAGHNADMDDDDDYESDDDDDEYGYVTATEEVFLFYWSVNNTEIM